MFYCNQNTIDWEIFVRKKIVFTIFMLIFILFMLHWMQGFHDSRSNCIHCFLSDNDPKHVTTGDIIYLHLHVLQNFLMLIYFVVMFNNNEKILKDVLM